MKSVKLLFMAVAAFSFVQVKAQSLEEVINSHINAMGGKEKLSSLKSVRMTGSMSTQGIDIAMTMTRAHMMGMRLDMDIMGSSNYQLLNQKEGWVFMPVMGMAEPQKMEEEQHSSALGQLDVQGAFMNYQEKGSKAELVGKEDVNGSSAFKIKLTNKLGKESMYYIDAKTYQVVKTTSKANVQGQDMEMETTFSDIKQNADGYWFPYSTTSMQGTIVFDKIETNVAVDEKLFQN